MMDWRDDRPGDIGMIAATRRARWIAPAWLEPLIFIGVVFVGQLVQAVFTGAALVNTIGTANTVVSLFGTLMPTGIVLLYCLLAQGRSWRSLGLMHGRAWWHYLIGVGGGLALLAFAYAAAALLGGSDIHLGSPSAAIVILAAGFIVQSFSEELMCRGYLMNSVIVRSNIPVGIVVNSLVFAALHLFNPGVSPLAIINLALVGIIMSMLAILVDNIWLVSGMHFAWNWALACIVGGSVSGVDPLPSLLTVTLSGPDLVTGGAFGIEAGIGTTAAYLTAGVIVAMLLVRKHRRSRA